MKTLIPILTVMLVAILPGCDGLVGAETLCAGESTGGQCSASLQGIPPFPPPPCWNEAGEIQSDEVCARVHEEETRAEGEGENAGEDEAGMLPGPPELPE